ncbi:MAG: class I SAM-dependent methyltransferase [Acidobacteriota bacterium]
MSAGYIETVNTKVEEISKPQEYRFIEDFYDLSTEDHFWFQWRFRAFVEQLRSLAIEMDKPFKVLDVGSGIGTLRSQIEKATEWAVDITDLDRSALEKALPGRGRTYYYDVTEQKPDLHEAYDAVVLFDVLEHIKETHGFIDSILYHVKPGGYVFLNVPSLMVLFSRYDEVQGHYRRYDAGGLKREFDGLSVEILDTRYWGLGNIPPLLIRRFWLKWFAGGKTDEQIWREGFSASSGIVNRAFLALMKAETFITKRPFSGSSILMAVRKL